MYRICFYPATTQSLNKSYLRFYIGIITGEDEMDKEKLADHGELSEIEKKLVSFENKAKTYLKTQKMIRDNENKLYKVK